MKGKYHAAVILYRIAAVFFVLMLFTHPGTSFAGAADGLLLWYKNVLPVQFPFFVGVRLLWYSGCLDAWTKGMNGVLKRLFHLPGCAAAALLAGYISGYPAGAQMTLTLYQEKRITAEQYEHILCFCNTPGPLFVISTVGGRFLKDVRLGYGLMAVQILSAVCCGILLRTKRTVRQKMVSVENKEVLPLGKMLQSAILESIHTVVMVGGFIVLFSVLMAWLPETGSLGIEFLYGCLEMTNGTSLLARNGGTFAICLISALLAFGGCCIQMQILSAIQEGPRLTKKYLFSRLLQGGFAFLGAWILLWTPWCS